MGKITKYGAGARIKCGGRTYKFKSKKQARKFLAAVHINKH